MSQLKFRVFRLDHPDAEPAYVGTFDGDNAKDAIRQGIYADERGGEAIYEAHVLGNASVFDARSRIEQFIDSLTQLNTQQFFRRPPAGIALVERAGQPEASSCMRVPAARLRRPEPPRGGLWARSLPTPQPQRDVTRCCFARDEHSQG